MKPFIRITNIVWDADAQPKNLPNTFNMFIPHRGEGESLEDYTDRVTEHALETLSYTFEFMVNDIEWQFECDV